MLHMPPALREYLDSVGVDALCAGTSMTSAVTRLLLVHDAVDWDAVRGLPPFQANLMVPRESVRLAVSTLPGAVGGFLLGEGPTTTLGVPSIQWRPPSTAVSWFPPVAVARVTPARRAREEAPSGAGSARGEPRARGARGRAVFAPPVPRREPVTPVGEAPGGLSYPSGYGTVPSPLAGRPLPPLPAAEGGRTWYHGVGPDIDRVMDGYVGVRWTNARPGAVVVGAVQYAARLVDAVRAANTRLRADEDWPAYLRGLEALVQEGRPHMDLSMFIDNEVHSWGRPRPESG